MLFLSWGVRSTVDGEGFIDYNDTNVEKLNFKDVGPTC